MNKFLVVVVDVGDSCDGHARALGLYDTYEEADAFVKEDMRFVADCHKEANGDPEDDDEALVVIDWAKREVFADDSLSTGSMWDIIDLGKLGK